MALWIWWGSHQRQTELPHQTWRMLHLWEDQPLHQGVYVLPERKGDRDRKSKHKKHCDGSTNHYHCSKKKQRPQRILKSPKKNKQQHHMVHAAPEAASSSRTISDSTTTSKEESSGTEAKDDTSHVIDPVLRNDDLTQEDAVYADLITPKGT